jgi:hypothetical protein
MKNLIVIVVVSSAVFSAWWAFPFIKYSQSRIEKQVLTATPPGTSYEEVEKFISDKGWRVSSSSQTLGFLDQRVRPDKEVGTMHIRAHAVSYDRIFGVDITVFWGFDESGKLINTWVWRTVNSI